jgi:hypothetical protein
METINLKEVFKNNGITSKIFLDEFNKFKKDIYPKIKRQVLLKLFKEDFDRYKDDSDIVNWLRDGDYIPDDVKDYQPTDKEYEKYLDYFEEANEDNDYCCASDGFDSGYSDATTELKKFLTWLDS